MYSEAYKCDTLAVHKIAIAKDELFGMRDTSID